MKAIVCAGLIALAVTLVATRYFIRYLLQHHYGQFVRNNGPRSHLSKQGTPTMGGAIVIGAVLLAYFTAHLVTLQRPTVSALLVLGVLIASALLGFIDDWSKIKNRRSLGLSARMKILGQGVIGIAFGVLSLQFPDSHGVTPASTAVSFTRDINWSVLRLPVVVAVVWMTFLIAGFTNAVNLTDGLDGLASGSAAMVFGAYGLINIWQRNQWCERSSTAGPLCYQARDPFDLALVSIALAAACFGFLWWNARPAKIYLGDTGALGLGAAMGAIAICTRTELLLVVLGALFVIETASVAIQIGYFKLTKGKRVFKMAPLHHHFELLGWEEPTVVVRFWILCGVAICVGFGLFYAEWVLYS